MEQNRYIQKTDFNPSANIFVFGDFNIHHKDWLTYSGGTDQPGEISYSDPRLWFS